MRHQDSSTHEWVPGCQGDLRVTREDATRAIYSAFFVEEAGTLSRVHGGREVIEATGLFRSRYPDRGSHSRHTAAAGGCGDTIRLTPVHRAVHQVGITRLPAYSPEARGRSKRRVRTLQDRRPQERALAGLTERAAANRSRREGVLQQSNDRVMGRATEPGPACIPGIGTHLANRLGVHEERGVAQANTVRAQRTTLQIPHATHRFHAVTVPVRVHAYPNGTLAVLHGPRCGARYHAEGRLIETGGAEPGRRAPTHGSGYCPILILGHRGATQFRRAAE